MSVGPISRRAFIGVTAAAAGAALVGLSRKSGRAIAGGFVDDGGAAGHRLRDGVAPPAPRRAVRVPIVIVGGGIAGLSAAWQLERRGMRDFVLLEMERSAGGNARWGENEITSYPWAAHYIPVPGPRATLVRELLAELGVLRDGKWDERHLCFAPQERLFLHGEWRQGIEPEYALPQREQADFRRFAGLVDDFRASGDFTIPMALGARPSRLDGMSMAAWLDRERLASPALRWYVDYACRDDYGARADHVSAWAGIHYFASREPDEEGPLTWPEGNGWVARRLIAKLERHIVTGVPVHRVERHGAGVRVLAADAEYVADAVIFAAPGFLAPHVVEGERPAALEYSPWLTANLVLHRWPAERGAAPAWDNVLYDSPALGYVVANHQSLRTHEERWVWTYYWALADLPPREARALLLRRSWREWTELILADLARAHPDIRDCVSRVDIMRMGHAMVRPVPGFLSSPAHARAPALGGHLFWAHSDASGLSLFEEAQYRGVAAADGALALIGSST